MKIGTIVFRLHRMHKMQPIVTDDHGVCLSACHVAQVGFTVQKWLNTSRCCLGWTLPRAHGTVLDKGPDPPQRGGGGPTFKFWNRLYLWNCWSYRVKIYRAQRWQRALTKTVQSFTRQYGRGHVAYFWLCNHLHITGTTTARQSCACNVCVAIDAAFAKLLWPPVEILSFGKYCNVSIL